jgi:DNA-binding MarR family transcriptional regulator
MTIGLFLLSRMDEHTGAGLMSLYMFVLGVGIGGVMQVLVIVVQSAVDYKDLGTATSSATFFRQIGGSIGTAIFGAIFANALVGNLADQLRGVALPAGLSGGGVSPAKLAALPAAAHQGVVTAYADSLQTVFLVAAPIGLVAFLLTLTLPEIKLRTTVQGGGTDTGEAFAMPTDRTSLQEVEHQLNRLLLSENRGDMYARLTARAGLELEPRPTWLLLRFAERPSCTLAQLAGQLGVDPERLRPLARRLTERGLLERAPNGRDGRAHTTAEDGDDGAIVLTPDGRAARDALVAARREGLAELLAGWEPERHPELADRLRELAHALLADDDRLLSDARAQ